jgi:hypothetical protein
MASAKDAASLVLLTLYCFVSLRLMLSWRAQREARRLRQLTPSVRSLSRRIQRTGSDRTAA